MIKNPSTKNSSILPIRITSSFFQKNHKQIPTLQLMNWNWDVSFLVRFSKLWNNLHFYRQILFSLQTRTRFLKSSTLPKYHIQHLYMDNNNKTIIIWYVCTDYLLRINTIVYILTTFFPSSALCPSSFA